MILYTHHSCCVSWCSCCMRCCIGLSDPPLHASFLLRGMLWIVVYFQQNKKRRKQEKCHAKSETWSKFFSFPSSSSSIKFIMQSAEITLWCPSGLSPRHLSVELDTSHDRCKTQSVCEEQILSTWDSRVAANPLLYNGAKFRLAGVLGRRQGERKGDWYRVITWED